MADVDRAAKCSRSIAQRGLGDQTLASDSHTDALHLLEEGGRLILELGECDTLRLSELPIEVHASIGEALYPAPLTVEGGEIEVEQCSTLLRTELPVASLSTTKAWTAIVGIARTREGEQVVAFAELTTELLQEGLDILVKSYVGVDLFAGQLTLSFAWCDVKAVGEGQHARRLALGIAPLVE